MPSEGAGQVIEIAHVSHWFGSVDGRTAGRSADCSGPLHALDDVDTAIADGTFVSLLGPSGCGKTTLLRIVDGLLRPSQGGVLVDGQPVRRPSSDRAMVFQEFNLLPWRTVAGNAELGLEIQGVERARRREMAEEALRLVGLQDFRRHYPHELSGGMKQLVGFARAFSTGPRYLLMDEPFGSLDPQIREVMQHQLTRIWEERRTTVLFVTHSVDEAIYLSDRVVVFSARPARILQTIDVRIPRPRWADPTVRSSAAFQEYRSLIWSLLQRELPTSVTTSVAKAG